MRFSTNIEDEIPSDVMLSTIEYFVSLTLSNFLLCIDCYIVYMAHVQIYEGVALPTRDGVQTIACSEENRSKITLLVPMSSCLLWLLLFLVQHN